MSDETPETKPEAAAKVDAASDAKVDAVLGAKGRRALLAKLPPLGWQGAQVLDAMKLESSDDLAKVLDLTADDFLDPLWERVHGRST